MQTKECDRLLKLIRRTRNGRLRVRYLAILNFLETKNRTETAKRLKVSRQTVNRWVASYLAEGLDGLIENPRSGRPIKLTEKQQAQLGEYIKKQANSTEGGRLTGKKIRDYIKEKFDIDYSSIHHLSGIYRLLNSLGFSWITSRSKHPKQSEEAQEKFKKNFS